MPRILIAIIAGILALAAFAAEAAAQKRVALVIGNGAYTKVPRLDNPKNDAAAMEAMFKAAGFTTVVRLNDLGVAAMKRALRDFSDTARDADIAVVFYAGHGIEVAGVNYLIPTDAVLERDIDVQDEAVSLDRIGQVLEPVKRLRLIILDACRDNPFARSMKRTIATRSVRSGYGEIDERSLPPNTLVAYAQRAGLTAEDGTGSRNSPFTTALIKHLPTPGLDIELALRRVRDEVLQATKNRQEPFKYGSLSGAELPLVTAIAGTAEPPKKVEPQAPSPLGQAAAEWDTLRTKTDIAALEEFAARHKGTYFADLAQARIDELRKQQQQRVALTTSSGSESAFAIDDVVEQWRNYDHPSGQFRQGPDPMHRGRKWKVRRIAPDGVVMELLQGTYYDLKPGETTRFYSSDNYKTRFPNAPPNEQIFREFRKVSSR